MTLLKICEKPEFQVVVKSIEISRSYINKLFSLDIRESFLEIELYPPELRNYHTLIFRCLQYSLLSMYYAAAFRKIPKTDTIFYITGIIMLKFQLKNKVGTILLKNILYCHKYE